MRRSRDIQRERDFVSIARSLVEQSIGEKLTGQPLDKESEKNPRAVAAGKLGGKKGGAGKFTKPPQVQANRKEGRYRPWASRVELIFRFWNLPYCFFI